MIKELEIANKWLASGQKAVLAVVADTWGSAPRRAGSLMVIRDDGTFEGSVSGGCVEGTVIAEAQAMLDMVDNARKTLKFSVASETAWEVGLACGGEITIWLFLLRESHRPALSETIASLANGQSGQLTINESSAEWQEVALKPNKAKPFKEKENSIVPIPAPVSLHIVGAVHIAQHLAAMAHECGWDVTIVDPREAFSGNRGFAGAKLATEWPDDYFRNKPLGTGAAVVTLTHDPKLDDAALKEILLSDAFYIGCLGSRKTHASRLDRLESAGFSPDILQKINGPVGLDIGSATPAEIAVSIMAQIIEANRKPNEV